MPCVTLIDHVRHPRCRDPDPSVLQEAVRIIREQILARSGLARLKDCESGTKWRTILQSDMQEYLILLCEVASVAEAKFAGGGMGLDASALCNPVVCGNVPRGG